MINKLEAIFYMQKNDNYSVMLILISTIMR